MGILNDDGMNLSGVLATHYHPDHVGGSMMGHTIEGVRELLEIQGTKIHVQADEADLVKKVTEISDTDLEVHQPGDHIMVGDIRIDLLHTPGHTPGSQCFLVEGTLVAGDTLFLEGCGRTVYLAVIPQRCTTRCITRSQRFPTIQFFSPGIDILSTLRRQWE